MHRLRLVSTLLAAGLAAGPAAAQPDPTVTVYQLSGAVHCQPRNRTPPERAADLLRAQGVTVISAQRRSLPLERDGECGAPTGEANVVTVAAADWTAFTNQNPDAAGYGLWVFDEPTVDVYRYDGSLQCGLGQEIPLEQMAEDLRGADIEVLASRKGSDGLPHISVCGASTGSINVYRIPREALAAAQAINFRMLVTREMAQQIKPRMGRRVGMQGRFEPAAAQEAPEPIPLLW